MKKIRNFIFLITALFLFTSCDLDNPEYKGIENLNITEITKDKLSFNLDVSAFNPNNHKINVRKSTFKVYIDGDYIGDAHLLEKYKMPKRETVTQTVPIELELKKGSLFMLIGKTQRKSAEIRIEGILKGSFSGLPFRKKINEKKNVDLKDLNINLNKFPAF